MNEKEIEKLKDKMKSRKIYMFIIIVICGLTDLLIISMLMIAALKNGISDNWAWIGVCVGIFICIIVALDSLMVQPIREKIKELETKDIKGE